MAFFIEPKYSKDIVKSGVSKSHPRESNPRPTDYESVALPSELRWLKNGCEITQIFNPDTSGQKNNFAVR